MRIIVTGGNGYVGRELCRLLYKQHEVAVIDTLRYGRNRFTAEDGSRVRFLKTDINDAAAVGEAIAGFQPQAVIHLAAVHYIPECETNPSLAVMTNVVGTLNMLNACPPGCRFVYASSGAVYKPDVKPHHEDTATLEPTDIYGFSKLQGEQYVRHFARTRNLGAVIVRLFNVVGPGETNPHLLPEIVAQLKAGRTKVHLGSLWPRRDYIHVMDAARGFSDTALHGSVLPGEVVTVNLGTSAPYSVAEIVKKLRDISGSQFTLEEDLARIRKVDRPLLAADNRLIQKIFGWRAAHTIDDALADLWKDPDLADNLMAKYQ
ncbi:MAG TPA: NAD-dependent epimerase/dehydratase family protein [Xanthobacteraceae bacterium]|nr:NAD-dependent epimerase/dehydratase family protein [Xanthobacteraceae bacterium]